MAERSPGLQEVYLDRLGIRLILFVGIALLTGCAYAPQPIAVATADALQGYSPLEVAFDATGSTSAAGSISSHKWNFGDGATATLPNVTHTYEAKGTYRVQLTILDATGRTASDELAVQVLNRIPHAEFRFSPFGAPRDFPVQFDASGSFDPDGLIVAYLWDFGDGTAAQGVRVTHVFPQRGVDFHVTLTVVDDDGAENQTVRIVVALGCDTCG